MTVTPVILPAVGRLVTQVVGTLRSRWQSEVGESPWRRLLSHTWKVGQAQDFHGLRTRAVVVECDEVWKEKGEALEF